MGLCISRGHAPLRKHRRRHGRRGDGGGGQDDAALANGSASIYHDALCADSSGELWFDDDAALGAEPSSPTAAAASPAEGLALASAKLSSVSSPLPADGGGAQDRALARRVSVGPRPSFSTGGQRGKLLCLPSVKMDLAAATLGGGGSTSPTTPSRRLQRRMSSLLRRKPKGEASSAENPRADGRKMLQRPRAGLQVPQCPADRPASGCWSVVDASTFKIRGRTYLRDKKKVAAAARCIYEPVGMDVFLSGPKLRHVAQLVELPPDEGGAQPPAKGALPRLLVVNVQASHDHPTDRALGPLVAVFGGTDDGEGVSVVFYCRLNEEFEQSGPPQAMQALQRFMTNEMEMVKGRFMGETAVPFRERLKIVTRLMNLPDLDLTAAERKLALSFHEKPVLSRPQHEFFEGPTYLEIDLDVHRFSFLGRKFLHSLREKLRACVIDISLLIQANSLEELPEHMLCALRLHQIDFSQFDTLLSAPPSPTSTIKSAPLTSHDNSSFLSPVSQRPPLEASDTPDDAPSP
eukprot:SM000008S22345  [mRNA]  locus=s8:1116669:1119230:- [translate_table: standard]